MKFLSKPLKCVSVVRITSSHTFSKMNVVLQQELNPAQISTVHTNKGISFTADTVKIMADAGTKMKRK